MNREITMNRETPMSLYKITQEYVDLIENAIDKSTGEILTPLFSIKESAENLKKKMKNVAAYIKNLEARERAIQFAMEDMRKRANSLENKQNTLRDYLLENMERTNINVILSPEFDIKIKKCPPSLDIFDESKIPESFLKIKIEQSVDKMKLKECLKKGLEIK